MPIVEDVQKYDVGKMVELFEVDLARLGVPTVLRFSPSSNMDTLNDIVFGGNDYVAADIGADGFEWSSQGAFPEPTLSVSNVFNAFSALNVKYNDMVGAVVTRIVTFEAYLDTGSQANPSAPDYLLHDKYRIDRKVQQNKIFVEYALATFLDQEGRQVPARQFQRDTCDHVYRRWNASTNDFDYNAVTCPYAGDACFDLEGDIASPADDKCSKKLSSGCIKRFGWPFPSDGGMPFRGFPGMTDIPR